MKALSISAIAILAPAFVVSAAPAEETVFQHHVEKEVVVVGDEGQAALILAEHGLDESDLECTEKDGHKICIADKTISTHDGDSLSATRGYLGVHLTPISGELREHFGAPEGSGVLISKVEEGSPAQAAGIEVGDVITAVDGDAIDSAQDLSRRIAAREDGELATLEFYRGGRLQQVTATLGARKEHPAHRIRMHLDDGDHGEIFKHIQKSLGDIDFSFISERVHEGLSGGDWEQIQETLHQAHSEASEE